MRRRSRMLGAISLLITAAGVSMQACAPAEADASRTSHDESDAALTLLELDHSMSRTAQQISADSALIAAVVGRLNFGDQLIVAEVHGQGRQDNASRWSTKMPGARDRTNPTPLETDSLTRARSAAVNAVALLSQSHADQFRHTDLFASFYDAADFISGSSLPHTRIVIFSDMLQSTPELNMESAQGIPGTTWVAEQALRIPQLTGACVAVIGADVSRAEGPELRQFWDAYFKAAGAQLRDYRFVMSDLSALHC